jgi:hypothetical protein
MDTPGIFEASCHCGAVRLEADHPPPTVTECNCSICRRYGARWAYFTHSTARVIAAADAIAVYSWGDREIGFCHCTHCGCLTHYESSDKSGDYRIAINARMAAPEKVDHIRVRHFDGAGSWTYLDG